MSSGDTEKLWQERLEGGSCWSHVLKRGTALRLTDPEGGANVGAMLYSAENMTERYNMPDTLKCQHIARLTAGNALYSDMGRILCSVVEDSCGWHDPLGGHVNAQLAAAKYGARTYQEAHNSFHTNARDAFLIELGKYGLGERDLVANINFFSKVTVTETGTLQFHAGNSKPCDSVVLRAEMNTLIILNAFQHPLDPAPFYEPKPVELTVEHVATAGSQDAVRQSCPENGRGFLLTERHVA